MLKSIHLTLLTIFPAVRLIQNYHTNKSTEDQTIGYAPIKNPLEDTYLDRILPLSNVRNYDDYNDFQFKRYDLYEIPSDNANDPNNNVYTMREGNNITRANNVPSKVGGSKDLSNAKNSTGAKSTIASTDEIEDKINLRKAVVTNSNRNKSRRSILKGKKRKKRVTGKINLVTDGNKNHGKFFDIPVEEPFEKFSYVEFYARGKEVAIYLSTAPIFEFPCFEMVLGAFPTESIQTGEILGKKSNTYFPQIIHELYPRLYWMRWNNVGAVQLGIVPDDTVILNYTEPNPFDFAYIGFASRARHRAYFEVYLDKKEEKPNFKKITTSAGKGKPKYYETSKFTSNEENGYLEFDLRTQENGIIFFLDAPNVTSASTPLALTIGAMGNTMCVIGPYRRETNRVSTEIMLHPKCFCKFWLQWESESIKFGTKNLKRPIIEYAKQPTFKITYLGFSTNLSDGEWNLYSPNVLRKSNMQTEPRWEQAESTDVIEDAFDGGFNCDGESSYVARAYYEGSLLPGMLVLSNRCAYVTWNQEELCETNFEFLKRGNYEWVRVSNSNSPSNAVEAGKAVDGEVLFPCRVYYQCALLIGRTQQGRCLVTYSGQVFSVVNYEILTQ